MAEEYVVQMKGITKVYPNGIAANQDVDLNIRKGEIHALMGENGAGKSTLMKMLFGLEQPTSGEIWINGEKVALTSPTVAIATGIGMDAGKGQPRAGYSGCHLRGRESDH